jgi:hypothetical protein
MIAASAGQFNKSVALDPGIGTRSQAVPGLVKG